MASSRHRLFHLEVYIRDQPSYLSYDCHQVNAQATFIMDEPPKSIMDLPAIREFDAFPKTLPTYKERSSRGGVMTVVVGCLIMILIWHELREYLFGAAAYSFSVDNTVGHQLGLNFDVTIAMPCHCEPDDLILE